MKKFLAVIVASAALVFAVANPAIGRGKGGTPFETSTSMSCDGVISWSVAVGAQPTQIVWVTVDYLTVAMQRAPAAGTYSGTAGGYSPAVSHIVILRRVVDAKVEEQVIRNTGACV